MLRLLSRCSSSGNSLADLGEDVGNRRSKVFVYLSLLLLLFVVVVVVHRRL
jgi:hypothetical protein